MNLSKNFLSLAGAEVVSKVVTFGAFAYLARVMGPDGFGYIEFAAAVLLCAGLFVEQGFGSYGAREIAKSPKYTPVLVAEIVTVRFLLAIIAYIAVVALALLLDRPPVVTQLLLIYSLSLLAMPLLLQWVFQGHDQMQFVSVLHLIHKSVFAILVLAFVHDAETIWFVAVAELAAVCSAVAYSIWIYRHRFGGTIQRPSAISTRLFYEGVPIGLSQMFLMVRMFPLYLIWKAAASVGLIHALRGDDARSFWQGVGRYSGKAVLLGLLFLVLALIGVVGLLIVAGGLSAFWPGEVGTFWINFVILPTLAISGLAVLDLMHDYARMALVVDEKKVFKATFTGLAWPFKHGQASGLYVAWFVPAAVLLLLPTVLDMNVAAATGGAIWGLFLMQQILMLLRAGVTVGWFGSETALYETIRLREMPLIAEEEAEVSVASEEMLGSEQGGLASA